MSNRTGPTLLTAIGAALALLCVGCGGASTPTAQPTSTHPTTAGSPTTQTPSPSATPTPSAAPRGRRITSTFFGMHDGRIAQGIAPDAPVGAFRLWDDGTSWRDLEKSPGSFDWTPLDTAVSTAHRVHARPLLVLGQTPTFYASQPHQAAAYGPGAASMPQLDAWRRYVTAVAARYRAGIDYEIWNEPNVVGYWTGTPEQMARLTVVASRAIRTVAPGATIVSPSFVLRLPGQRSWFEKFWALQSRRTDLGGALTAVSVHLYPLADGLPEAEVPLVDAARSVLADHGVSLPLWNTEINYGLQGGPPPPPIPDTMQRAFLIRTYLLDAGLGIRRVYWYRWDIGHIANTYLTRDDGTETPAGRSFDVVRSWLGGTRFARCGPADADPAVWECAATKGQHLRTFWWKPRGPATHVTVGHATSWTNADGAVTSCPHACRVPVGATPVMVVGPR